MSDLSVPERLRVHASCGELVKWTMTAEEARRVAGLLERGGLSPEKEARILSAATSAALARIGETLGLARALREMRRDTARRRIDTLLWWGGLAFIAAQLTDFWVTLVIGGAP